MIGRRQFVRNVFAAAAIAPLVKILPAHADAPTILDPVLKATIPQGMSLRAVAYSGKPAVNGGKYLWHAAPDGGACFGAADGGWIYVSNSEIGKRGGGAGALRFDAIGAIVDSYPVLQGTSNNCAGGKTPWGTWLSCEEDQDTGLVYECDPSGTKAAIVRPGLGAFNHEAAAVDPATGIVYLTEDRPDGCLYRFVPQAIGDLANGRLDVAILDGARLIWTAVPDVGGTSAPLRKQVPGAALFKGGEGIVYTQGKVFFTTKGDNRVWSLTIASGELAVIYDVRTSRTPILRGVDNIEVSPNGELLVAEDGGDMQIVALVNEGAAGYRPMALVTLHDQNGSEITGPSFSPDGKRLYFSSQRGPEGKSAFGVTYELSLGSATLAG
ncbi:MAG: alkaline phosphatase PhoX [Rhodospirillaceae bacterium]